MMKSFIVYHKPMNQFATITWLVLQEHQAVSHHNVRPGHTAVKDLYLIAPVMKNSYVIKIPIHHFVIIKILICQEYRIVFYQNVLAALSVVLDLCQIVLMKKNSTVYQVQTNPYVTNTTLVKKELQCACLSHLARHLLRQVHHLLLLHLAVAIVNVQKDKAMMEQIALFLQDQYHVLRYSNLFADATI